MLTHNHWSADGLDEGESVWHPCQDFGTVQIFTDIIELALAILSSSKRTHDSRWTGERDDLHIVEDKQRGKGEIRPELEYGLNVVDGILEIRGE